MHPTDHPPQLNRSQRVAVAIVRRLPSPLIRDTERVMLNVGTGLVGVISLLALAEPGTISDVLAMPLLILWSVTLIAGGILTLAGIFQSWRAVERGGMMLTGIGCLIYAAALFSVGSARAQIIGVLFLCIAATKAIRLLTSTAGAVAASVPQGRP